MIPLYTDIEYIQAKSNDLLPLRCEHCGEKFYALKKLITQEIKQKRGRCKYCSKECKYEAANKTVKTTCAVCGKDIIVKKSTFEKSKSKKNFCSHSCAASYTNLGREKSQETRVKISKSLLDYNSEHNEKRPVKICKVCGKEYHYKKNVSTKLCCSKKCSLYLKTHKVDFMSSEQRELRSTISRKAVYLQKKERRSKNEKYFCELCEKHFKNVTHNIPKFNGWDADVIIDDVRIAVLWNGKWHYEKITQKHSVLQVQTRDKIKISEIKKQGYEPYVIKDMGSYDPQFVIDEFEKFKAYVNKLDLNEK